MLAVQQINKAGNLVIGGQKVICSVCQIARTIGIGTATGDRSAGQNDRPFTIEKQSGGIGDVFHRVRPAAHDESFALPILPHDVTSSAKGREGQVAAIDRIDVMSDPVCLAAR